MAIVRIPYYPYNETMASIFTALGIEISTSEYGDELGWNPEEYTAALGAAKEAIFWLDYIDIDGDNVDDLAFVDSFIYQPLNLHYWSTESGEEPF